LSSILRDTPRAITDINPGLPRDIWRIVRHALAKDPDRRYQTAKDLRNELDDLTQSISSGELTAAPSIAPRSPWPLRLAFAVALTAVAAVAAWQWRGSDTTVNVSPPTLSHARLTQREGVERWPSISPDGKWVAYQSGGDIFLQSVTGQTAINLTQDSPATDATPAFSPDGETIAFRSARDGGGIFLMGRTGESVKRLTDGGFQPAWFPDGKTIVYASGEAPGGPENRTAFSELWTVPVDGGEPRLLHGGDAVQPRVSPNGQRIAYWDIPNRAATRQIGAGNAPANRDIWTIGADGKNPVRVAGHDANDWNPVWSPDGRWLYFLSNRSGSMGLWRVAIDESSGATRGDPQPLATPSWYVADFSLSADGTAAAYASFVATNNVARQRLDPRTARAIGEVEMITTGTNDFVQLDPTRDGRFIALTTSSRTQEDLYVLNVADGSLRRLTNDFARDRWPRWDRDNRSIYFYSDRRGYQIWRIDADGSGLRELTKEPGLNQMYPSLSPDGARMAASDQDVRQLVLYDTSDFSKPLRVATAAVEPKAGALQVHDWAPDGRSFLLSALNPAAGQGQQPSLWSFTIETGSTRRIGECGGPAWMADGRRLVCNRAGNFVVVDAQSGRSTDMGTAPRAQTSGGARLAVDDSQLFFLQGSISADIWVARFAPARDE
jgi:Tol biopolymer transport system component